MLYECLVVTFGSVLNGEFFRYWGRGIFTDFCKSACTWLRIPHFPYIVRVFGLPSMPKKSSPFFPCFWETPKSEKHLNAVGCTCSHFALYDNVSRRSKNNSLWFCFSWGDRKELSTSSTVADSDSFEVNFSRIVCADFKLHSMRSANSRKSARWTNDSCLSKNSPLTGVLSFQSMVKIFSLNHNLRTSEQIQKNSQEICR